MKQRGSARARRASAAPPAPSGTTRGTSLAYLPGLDGLRGVALFAILGVHAGVLFTSGGESGGFYLLDSFFALSGFLITSLLIAEWRRTDTIRLRAFWMRRARRLLPGLFLMLFGVSILYGIAIPPGTYPTLRGDAIASLLYFANWHFIAAGSNYFNQTGLPSPLIHMWSLSVEEQFYFVWPLLFLGVMRLARSLRPLLVLCIAGTIGSAVEMALVYHGTNATRVYFGTDTHGQSVLMGCGLAVGMAMWAERRRPSPEGQAARRSDWEVVTPAARRILTVLGVAGLAAAIVLLQVVTSSNPLAYRGGFALATFCFCLVLVSIACVPTGPVSRFFSLRPFQFLGQISYGVYLWHLPLFLYLDHERTGLNGWPLFGVRLAATLAVATLSYYLVEEPVRRGRWIHGLRGAATSVASAGAVAVAVVIGTLGPAVSAQTTNSLLSPLAATPITTSVPSTYADTPTRVLLVGDSTALTLGFGLGAASENPKYHTTLLDEGILGCGVAMGTTYTNDGQPGASLGYPCRPDASSALCPPGGGFGPDPNARCQPWPDAWRQWVQEFKPNVVALLAGGAEVHDRVFRGVTTSILSPAFAAYVKHQLEQAVSVATSGGALMVLMTAPCYDHGEQPDGSPWPDDNPARVDTYNRLVDEVAAEYPGKVYVQDLHSYVCPDGRYSATLHGVQIRQPDGVHFSIGTGVGGDFLAPAILPYWEELGHLQETETQGASVERSPLPNFYAPV